MLRVIKKGLNGVQKIKGFLDAANNYNEKRRKNRKKKKGEKIRKKRRRNKSNCERKSDDECESTAKKETGCREGRR